MSPMSPMCFLKDAVQRRDDALLHLFALHDGWEKVDGKAETIFVVFQLADKVAVAGSSGSRDDCDALGKKWNLQFALQVEDALFLQLADNLLPLAGHIADGVGGVYVRHNPGEAERLVELGVHPEQHFQSGSQRLVCSSHEGGL